MPKAWYAMSVSIRGPPRYSGNFSSPEPKKSLHVGCFKESVGSKLDVQSEIILCGDVGQNIPANLIFKVHT